MSATTEDGRAAWLGAVTPEDHPSWMPAEDVAVHRAAAEREAQRLRREREAAEEAAQEEVAARLHRARVVEAATGRTAVPSVGEILAREDERSDKAMARQERDAAVAAGVLTNLDAPAVVDELAAAREARGARDAAEHGQDLADGGASVAGALVGEPQPVAGAMYGQLGKRP